MTTGKGFRLSPQQRRLWQLQHPGGRPFLARCAVALRGELAPEALRSAVAEVAARLEVLRTTFSPPPDAPDLEIAEQHIEEDGPAWQDLSGACGDELWTAGAAGFQNLGTGPLVRVSLCRIEPTEHRLLLTLPTLLSDAVSLDLLVRQIAAAYASHRGGEPLPEPGLQYVDIAAWQNELLEGEETEAGRSYWREQRLPRIPAMTVPGARPQPDAPGRPRSLDLWIDLEMGGSLAARIAERSAEMGVSVGAFLLAGWQSLLWRLGEPERRLLGVVFDGRSYDGLEEAVGLLARSVPVAARVDGEQTFRELARQVEESLTETREWQEFFDWGNIANGEGAPPFLPVGFELTAWPVPVTAGPLTFEVLRREAEIDRFHLLLRASDGAGGLRAGLWYDEGILTQWQAGQLAGQLRTLLLDAAERPEQPVAELEILTSSERHRLLRELVGTPVAGSVGRCVHELFEEQARRTPDQPAVVCAGHWLTYAELSARSRALARRLRRLGVGPEVCAAVALERSVDMVAALLAVLQAGGAYVPLDPALPAERLALMLEDTDAAVLITQEHLRPSIPEWHTVLTLDSEQADMEGGEEPSGATADNLAYVLFTSGSTGRPKGVGVAHRQLVHYTENVRVSLDLPPGASFAMVSTIAADLGNTAIYPTLCSGGCLHLLTPDQTTDPQAFQDYLGAHEIDCLKIVPSHLQALQSTDQPARALPRQRLVVGGEPSSPKWIAETRALAPGCRIYNHYGPTETTVGVLTCHLAPAPGESLDTVSLGRPIGDTRVYLVDVGLVDAGLRPVPVGARGELLIGGSNVSRGYIGRPAETAAKFIPDPFGDAPGERLYRTGDLARLRPDGHLEFLGRIDSQVKLRGFRIELGEIEAALRREPGVREAVVALRSDPAGNQRLIAWMTGEPGFSLDADALREALLVRLPEPMVPSAFVRLEALPVTPNGKIDRRALPEPKPEKRRADLVAPRTPIERALAEIFQEVLRLEQVGIHDNFFQVGGDSILSIQVVARASRRGLRITSQQIFEHQSIAELAPRTEAAGELQAEQGEVTGPVPLTPIQGRFFSQGRTDPHHYNQAVLLAPLQPLRPAVLEEALKGLLRHHDALRLRFAPGETGWQQVCGVVSAAVIPLLRLDLSALSSDTREQAWLAAAEAFQAGFDLGRGPLFRALWGELGAAREETRLLLAAHHLVVDGVSWRILLEDLERGYGQLDQGEALALPPKTTSFKHWAERLRELAGSARLLAEAPFWRSTLEPPPVLLPVEEADGRNEEASVRTVRISLDAASTRALLQEVHTAYNTRINDLLLTGLAQAFARWTGVPELLVELEGHGREDALFDDVDLSRTVGWFTAIYPVRLRLADAADPSRSLKTVKEQLRAIPRGGIGYGVLCSLGTGEVCESLRGLAGAQVVFNYLGQFDQAAAESRLFGPGAASLGAQRSPRGERRYLLEVSAQVTGGQLHVDWAYSRNLHSHAAIERLATGFRDAVQELIACCLAPDAGGHTPSDFPLARLDQRQLDQLLGREWRQVEDVYPLSPMQQSLLFYALHNPGSPVGVEQMSFTLSGDLDRGLFWKAWQQVVDRLPILRTGFVWEGVREALQVVRRGALLSYREEDWRGAAPGGQDRLLLDFLEREREQGLDLKRPPLMRLALVRLAETTYRFVSTRHHLILDGWSGMQLLQQAFSAYEALRAGSEPLWEPVQPYRRYIAWLQEQDLAEAEAFWRRRLQGFTEPTPVPVDRPAAGLAPPETGHEHLQLPAAATAVLEQLGRENRLTLNVLVQGAWALLLSHWSGRLDVVFGSTVSGRPATLPGVESIVGLFINNLPVRARIAPGRPAIGWLQDLQQRMMEASAYDYTPPERVQEWSEVPRVRRLFETLCVFENYPMDDPAEAEAASSLVMRDLRAPVKTSYLLTLVAVPGRALDLTVAYDRRRLEASTVRRLLADLGTLLETLPVHAGQPLSALLAALPEPPLAAVAPEPVHRGEYVAPREPLERALAEIFEEILGLRPIGVTDDFFTLGGSSLLSLSLMRRIQERLGRHLPLPSLIGGATVERLASTLRQHAAGWDHRSLVPLQTEGEKLPFFCVHSAGGMVLNLLELARSLGEDQPVYALQDPAFLADEPPAAGVEEMAANYLAELRTVQPAGPYRLGGHSFGGVVAFEMAQQLRRQGEDVELVALFDSGAPGRSAELADDARVLAHISEILGRFYGRSLAVPIEELEGLTPEAQLELVLDRLRALPEQAGADPRQFARFIRLYKHHMSSSRRYQPQPCDSPLTLFRAAESSAHDLETAADLEADLRAEWTLGWNALSALPVAVIEVPGDHTTMLSPPQVAHLAARLRRCLDHAEGELIQSISLPMSEEHELRPQG